MEDIKEKTKQKTTPHELKNLKKWKNEKQAKLKGLVWSTTYFSDLKRNSPEKKQNKTEHHSIKI